MSRLRVTTQAQYTGVPKSVPRYVMKKNCLASYCPIHMGRCFGAPCLYLVKPLQSRHAVNMAIYRYDQCPESALYRSELYSSCRPQEEKDSATHDQSGEVSHRIKDVRKFKEVRSSSRPETIIALRGRPMEECPAC